MIGLQKYEKVVLFTKLFAFTCVIIFTGLQLNYFHEEFLKYFITVIAPESEVDEVEFKSGESSTDPGVLRWQLFNIRLLDFIKKALLIIQIHYSKMMFIFMFWQLTENLSILNALMMILLSFCVHVNCERIRNCIIKITSFLMMSWICALMSYRLLTKAAPVSDSNVVRHNQVLRRALLMFSSTASRFLVHILCISICVPDAG